MEPLQSDQLKIASSRQIESKCLEEFYIHDEPKASRDPAVPGVSQGNGELEVHSESPLTPIESERGPSPKGQGYGSALSEPDYAESAGPAENPVEQAPQLGGMSGGRVDSTENGAPGNSQADKPLEYLDENINSPFVPKDVESQEAGPSSEKGKGVDPQNWGAMDLDHDEQPLPMFEEFQAWQHRKTEHIEAKYQAQINELKEKISDWKRISDFDLGIETGPLTEDRDKVVQKGSPTNEDARKLPGRPSELIALTSHIGCLFYQMQTPVRADDLSATVDTGNVDLMDVDQAPRAKGMRIKLLKPTEIYNGSASLQSFQKNMREIIAYLEDGQVPEYHQVEVALRFLKGKAYTFFEWTCGDNASEWNLKQFLCKAL
ncbi:hypothetical protein EV360DRAFT_86299 [Lentinula raphanica]|nr:hypothetical protein EV360DRAFT_86299 [Lentinula raphanica]